MKKKLIFFRPRAEDGVNSSCMSERIYSPEYETIKYAFDF